MDGSSPVESSSRVVNKGVWSEEEDLLLRKCIEKYGEGKWHQVPLRSGLNRCRKSCRLRWLNYLQPNIKRGKFEPDEVDLIIRMHKLLGNRWSLIAGRIPGRTANDIKNYRSTMKKKSKCTSKLDEQQAMMLKRLGHSSHAHGDDQQLVQKHKLPRSNISTKVFKPISRKISQPIIHNASVDEHPNQVRNNCIFRMLENILFDETEQASNSAYNDNLSLSGFENTTSFHVEEARMKLNIENGNGKTSDDFYSNFDQNQWATGGNNNNNNNNKNNNNNNNNWGNEFLYDNDLW